MTFLTHWLFTMRVASSWEQELFTVQESERPSKSVWSVLVDDWVPDRVPALAMYLRTILSPSSKANCAATGIQYFSLGIPIQNVRSWYSMVVPFACRVVLSYYSVQCGSILLFPLPEVTPGVDREESFVYGRNTFNRLYGKQHRKLGASLRTHNVKTHLLESLGTQQGVHHTLYTLIWNILHEGVAARSQMRVNTYRNPIGELLR